MVRIIAMMMMMMMLLMTGDIHSRYVQKEGQATGVNSAGAEGTGRGVGGQGAG